jgi:hypothetical protein
VNSKQFNTTFEIVENVRGGWLGIKGYHNVDEARTRIVVSNMVVSNYTQNLTTIRQLIRMNLRILNKRQSRIVQLEEVGWNMQWASAN